MSYQHYDNAGRAFGLNKGRVVHLVRLHGVPKRRIYGQMAVDADAWEVLMSRLAIPWAPGYGARQAP